jgi:hypothetical protein
MSARKKFRQGLKRSALSLAVGMVLASGGAQAQSNISGSIFGKAAAGDVIVIENAATGFKREIQAGSDGSYRASQTPSGTYVVSVRRADGSTLKRENVIVNVGVGTPVNFAGVTEFEAVEVLGAGLVNPIDVSSVESATIMTAEKVAMIPVQRQITNVALLAPGTVKGDNRFGNLASFGGASVAENVYYVNGFNVTNIVTGLAFSQVPFQSIAEQQVKTGGYGAEFGRSLGGVVNLITKRGTNDFGGNVSVVWQPRSLNTTDRFAYDPERDGVYVTRDGEEVEALRANLELSGPIIKDRLFFYALIQGQQEDSYQVYENGSATYKETTPQGLVKIDWNISDRHVLELTAFRDETDKDGRIYQRPAGDLQVGGGDQIGTSNETRGGDNYIARWTGFLTDTFSLSAMYGEGEYSRGATDSNSASCPLVIDRRSSTTIGLLGVAGCWVNTTIGDPAAGDKRTAYRLDGEWTLGDHTFKFGLDNEEFDTKDSSVYSGFGYWRYVNTTAGSTLTGNGGIVPTGVTEAVRFRYFENGGQFLTKNSAWYVEDTWRITPNFLISAGIRNESFENQNAEGGSFIKVNDTWAPRLGFSWDIKGDSTMKLFGNAGRYYIPVYSNTNVRLAGAELDWFEWYTFTSIDPDTGVPSGISQLGTRFYTSDGEVPDPRAVVDNNLSPMYQDEFILGFQQQVDEHWTIGVRGVYRDLKSGMDDICNYNEPYYWALENGYDEGEADAIASAVNHCFLTNPGNGLSANVDLQGDGNLTVVEIPAEGLGLPVAQRKYQAIEFLFEGTWENLFLQGSYTWARSRGNTEGYVKSDNGQDDAGITQDFDYPGLMDGAYGYLPNDRRHSLKLFGNYRFNEEWAVGFNVLAQSGRPVNCFGVYPADGPDGGAPNYGVASFYCGTNVDDAYPGTLKPRGTSGRVPWVYTLDTQVTYEPEWADGLTLRMTVSNIFDSEDYTRVDDSFDDSAREPSYSYGFPRGYVRPRSVFFMASYKF